jgi:uncharacterized protein YbcI
MVKKTRHELETDLTKAMLRFEKEYFGRGPLEVRTYIIQDMILVRMYGILTPAEQALAESRDGMFQVKDIRRQLFETSRPLLEEQVRQATGHRVVSLHTDLSTSSGERIVIFIVDTNLETVFPI